MNRIFAALALACAIALGGCQTNATGWGQLAAGVGAVLGETKIDHQIERVSARLAERCAEVQTAALAVDLFAPDKLRAAAADGRAVVASFCARPPKNIATALAALADAYAAIQKARRD
jgi:hypothetical protein